MISYSEKCDFNKLNRKLQIALGVLDRTLDIPVVATSGLRSPEHNEKVGGVKNSSHLKGLAIDLAVSDSKARYLIILGALMAGFKRIGIGKTHIHLDIDPDKDAPIIFFDNM